MLKYCIFTQAMGQYMYNPNTMECDLGNANKVARLVYLVVDAFIPVMLIFILYFFVFIMVRERNGKEKLTKLEVKY